jgi:Polyketide cyclase / dehydrase and lipid transport
MFIKTTVVTLGIAASVLNPLAGNATDTNARPVKDLSHSSSEIHWPQGFDPKTADAFVHNDIFIKAPAKVIWDNLVKATEWPKWYSNSLAVQIEGGAKTELDTDVGFTWKTFGFPVKSTVHEFVPNQRVGWFGSGTGIQAYHTWLIVPRNDGCEVITEETQVGPSAIQFNIEQPTAMYDGHHWWLAALKYRSEHSNKN